MVDVSFEAFRAMISDLPVRSPCPLVPSGGAPVSAEPMARFDRALGVLDSPCRDAIRGLRRGIRPFDYDPGFNLPPK